MRQLLQMFLSDVRMSFKSFMGGLMLIMPLLALLILRTFLPGVESTTVTLAIVTKGPHAVEPEVVEALDFAQIETYDSIAAMEEKLRSIGSAEGLYRDPETGQYVSVLERSAEDNKAFSTAARYIRQYYFHKDYPEAPRVMDFSYRVPAELSGRTKASPVATMGGSIFIVFMVLVNAFLIGLGVVNDKEYGTDKAIRVTPVSKADYFIGKSLFPLLIILFYTIVALFVLKLGHVNILQVYVTILASFSMVLLFGLLIGALGRNETEAIGVGKLVSMLLMLAILGGTLLPGSWRWVVWWAPVYWMYDLLEEVFVETATWASVAWKSALIVGLTGLYFLLLRKKIIQGLG